MIAPYHWRLRNFRGLGSDRRGAAGIEFALLASTLLLLFFGLYAVTQVVRLKMLLSSTASSMASIVAMQSTVTNVTLQDACRGAGTGGVQLMMQPFAANGLSVSIISYTLQSDGITIKKDWEYNTACQSTAGSLTATTVKTDIATPLLTAAYDSVIIVQANYLFTSPYATVVPNSALSHTAFDRPRSGTVACITGCS